MAAVTNFPSLSHPPDLRRYRDLGLAYAMSPDDSARRFPGSNNIAESLGDFRYGEIAPDDRLEAYPTLIALDDRLEAYPTLVRWCFRPSMTPLVAF